MTNFMRKDGSIILPHLDHILKSYYFSTDIDIFVIDEYGNKILFCGNSYIEKTNYKICINELDSYIKDILISKDIEENDTFLYNHMKKLTYIIAPYFYNKTYRGAFIAGPILLNPKTSTDADEILEYYSLPISSKPDILKIISETPEKLPPKNFYIAQLLHHLMKNGMNIGMQHIEEMNMKRTFIGKSFEIEEFKTVPNLYNLAIIRQLAKTVILGNVEEAIILYRKGLNIHYYEYINNFDPIKIMKYNLVSLCTALIYSSITYAGVSEKIAFEIKNKHIIDIDNKNNIQDLLLSGEFMVKNITYLVNKHSVNDKSKPIQKAINYINNNYNTPLTLEKVANYVHLSSSYFSTLFKKEMNTSFKNYLNKIRIEQSKTLLDTTDESILDVALSVGFDNQNYFSTVFKKFTDMSPKKYITNH